jgi:prophage antirepressor-like protein
MTLTQINVFDTVIGNLMKDDPNIKDIKVYGTENNPLFVASDVLRYIQNTKHPAPCKKCKDFILGKEILSKKVMYPQKNRNGINHTTEQKVCLLTLHGLIRCLTFCNKPTVASTCFRQLVYSIFDHVKKSGEMPSVITQARESIETAEVQAELQQIREEEKGLVYFIKQKGSPYIKVGRTSESITTRLQQLQVGNPNELEVLSYFHCDSVAVESQIHKEYKEFRHRGEWFSLTDEQLSALKTRYCP